MEITLQGKTEYIEVERVSINKFKDKSEIVLNISDLIKPNIKLNKIDCSKIEFIDLYYSFVEEAKRMNH